MLRPADIFKLQISCNNGFESSASYRIKYHRGLTYTATETAAEQGREQSAEEKEGCRNST